MAKIPNPLPGKFLLVIKTPYGKQYYVSSGTYDAGTQHESDYLNWSKWPAYAYRFETLKRARSMARKLRETHKVKPMIMTREGEYVS